MVKQQCEQSDRRPEAEQGDINTTPARQRYWERNLSGEARRWFEEDARHFLHQSLSTPVLNVIVKADGAWLEDLNGKRYLDMHGNGVHNAGFNHPEVVRVVKKQLDESLTFCPRRFTNIPAVRLAKKLAEITPGDLCRSLFCPGGTDAIEMALKLAKLVTGRFKTISFWDSFHGAGFGASSVGGEEHFHGGLGPLVPGAFHVEFPNYYRNPWGFTREEDVDAECLRQIELIMRREPEMAAVLGEPVSANPVVPSKRYWEGVKELCERYGALLIFDEIIEGFGRTGKMFASEHYLTPDILVLGKSLGGGIVPLAGIVTREKYNICQDRSIGHYTHEKNALSAAAALAEIEVIEKNNLCDHAARLGIHAKQCLQEMAERHPLIGCVMGIGLHIGIDLVRDRKTKERAVREAERIMFKCLEKGLAFKTIEGNVITLRPALVITREEMDWALDILDGAIGEVERGLNY
ncbi:MAG: aspartate aminotransferase family protein [Proteobacteria bacterium]|nr:aspartate aminotransferase family protein [Pseudomonadota bacterium]MBU2252759.1 aspartate aminotransferase family protein [Pseudomonadota bacterium]